MDIASDAKDTSILDDDHFRRITEIFLRHGLNPQRFPHDLTACLTTSSETIRKNNSKDDTTSPGKRTKHVARRPQCTHVIVNRIHGNNRCHICTRLPSIGWLYVCQQDHQLEPSKPPPSIDAMPGAPNASDYFNTQARAAEKLEMSGSVVQGIQSRNYSVEEVERLLNQRRTVIQTIRKAEQMSSDDHLPLETEISSTESNTINSIGAGICNPHGAVGESASSPTPAGDSCSAVAVADGNHTTKPLIQMEQKQKSLCDFQVCHTCRPMFADRLYTSFEAVLNGEIPYLTKEEMSHLPLIDNKILTTIGLKKSHQPRQQNRRSEWGSDIVDHGVTDIEEDISVDWTPTNSSASEETDEHADAKNEYSDTGNDRHQILERPLGLMQFGSSKDRSKTPASIQPVSRPKSITPDNPEDLPWPVEVGLLGTPGGTSTASSISLPTPTTAPMVSLFPTDDPFEIALMKRTGRSKRARSTCSGLENCRLRRERSFFRQESSSSLGSEMEVEGGVALTEEAIEMGIPDILTEDVLMMRAA